MTTATIKRDGDTLRVRGELDFDSVAELWAMTKTLFRDGTVPRIDLNGVRHSNSAGVALLVEWLRHARWNGCVMPEAANSNWFSSTSRRKCGQSFGWSIWKRCCPLPNDNDFL